MAGNEGDSRTAGGWVAAMTCVAAVALASSVATGAAPQVSNVTAQQRSGTTLVDIYYDVYDADGDPMVVTATCHDGLGGSVAIASTQQGSDIGSGIESGLSKHIVWDAGVDMPDHAGDEYSVRVEACDLGDEPEMVLVPAGTFIMGDGEAWCGEDEREVTLTRSFYLGRHEVTNQEYMEAVQWAYDNGYVTITASSVLDNLDESEWELLRLTGEYGEIQYDGAGAFFLRESPSSYAQGAYPTGYDPADHPVKMVSWYGAVRYCDWLSVQAGLPRAYQHSGDWACNGGDPYGAQGCRLPTDAEWEYAAQYDDERIYPWGSEWPACTLANCHAYEYCVGWTSPVGSYPDAPAAARLSDMTGNVYEWCNDWYVCDLGTDAIVDPVGPESGIQRLYRGGSWRTYNGPTEGLRSATRTPTYGPAACIYVFGFRVARTANP